MQNAGLLGRASKVGSILYRYLPPRDQKRECYRQLTGWAMQLLKDEWDEADIIAELLPMLPVAQTKKCHQPDSATVLVIHPDKQYHFITSLYKRFASVDNTSMPIMSRLPGQSEFSASLILVTAHLLPKITRIFPKKARLFDNLDY